MLNTIYLLIQTTIMYIQLKRTLLNKTIATLRILIAALDRSFLSCKIELAQ